LFCVNYYYHYWHHYNVCALNPFTLPANLGGGGLPMKFSLNKYYIYKARKIGLQMNYTNIDEHNPICEELQTYKYRGNHGTIHTIGPKVKA
jgi:hypothetical protein